jgi:hypothetical protein
MLFYYIPVTKHIPGENWLIFDIAAKVVAEKEMVGVENYIKL